MRAASWRRWVCTFSALWAWQVINLEEERVPATPNGLVSRHEPHLRRAVEPVCIIMAVAPVMSRKLQHRTGEGKLTRERKPILSAVRNWATSVTESRVRLALFKRFLALGRKLDQRRVHF